MMDHGGIIWKKVKAGDKTLTAIWVQEGDLQ